MTRFSRIPLPPSSLVLTSLALLLALGAIGCSSTAPNPTSTPTTGKSEFESSPPAGAGSQAGDMVTLGAAAPEAATKSSGTDTATRQVEETDLYRLEGNRLYYLNSYRGLMVFDVSNVDSPKLLGRSPIFGEPVEMVVRDGIAQVVVADWYGKTEDNTPFHGSIVRGIDASDPAHMRVTGEARLGGWVRDTRVVGDVLYAVTERYPWDSVWYAETGDRVATATSRGAGSGASVAVTSVNFAGGVTRQVNTLDVPGQGGIYHVTANSILLASSELGPADANGYQAPTGRTELRYLDISDPAGAIRERSLFVVAGNMQGWGADNGRWNLDFADGRTAHALTCSGQYCSTGGGLVLSTVDFTNPDGPAGLSTLAIPSTSWSPTARFDTGRMYLSPSSSGCYSYLGTTQLTTPLEVFDLTDPAAPRLAGSTDITGQVWLFVPSGNRLFALGNDCTTTTAGYYGSQVSLRYLDVTDPNLPRVLGTANFGQGWAWTPAAGTFKAFTKDDAQGLVVLPFSGWDSQSYQYNNGLQLIEFSPDSLATSGTARTRGWVERGIFVNGRLVSLSDLSLSVIDYSVRAAPKVISELVLARNVVDIKPQGDTVAELSSDWWGYDRQTSVLRVLPLAEAEDNVSGVTLAEAEINGYNAQVFHHGNLSYVVSNVEHEIACPADYPPSIDGSLRVCRGWTQEVEVIDRSGGGAVKRGALALPDAGNTYYADWGWGLCGVGWYSGADAVQVGGDALVFRRWLPDYTAIGTLDFAKTALFVVDLKNPDQPTLASTTITSDLTTWWGNLRTVGGQLYASHYEWVRQPSRIGTVEDPGVVKYYLDQIDLSDRANPRVSAKINVPGILVGGSELDPSLLYTMDYRWSGQVIQNQLQILRLQADRAYLQSSLQIPGWVGNTFVRGNTAYFTVETYDAATYTSSRSLYQVDVSNPSQPVVLPSAPTRGWGWLLGVEGDRALVTSGWGDVGLDVFRLSAGAAPMYETTVRTRGWWPHSLARQNGQLFLASGYWGTQVIDLEQ